jgi:hypothetical protein
MSYKWSIGEHVIFWPIWFLTVPFRAVGSVDRLIEGVKAENAGRYKEAVWRYARSCATLPIFSPFCRSRINSLWNKFGPWQFEDAFIAQQETLSVDEVFKFAGESLVTKPKEVIRRAIQATTSAKF